MNALLVLAALCVIFQVSQGQTDCQSQIQAAEQCMHGGQAAANKTAAFQACFTNNGCSLPTTGSGTVNTSDPGACYRQVQEGIVKQKMLACVQQTVPSFTFPTEQNGGIGGGFGGSHHGGHGQGGNFAAMLNQSCPSQTAVQAVQTCLQQLQPMSRGRRHAGFNRGGQGRNMQQCFANLTADCQQELNATKQALCTCQSSLQNDTDIQAALAACPNNTMQGGRGRGGAMNKGGMLGHFCKNNGGKSFDDGAWGNQGNSGFNQGGQGRGGNGGQGRFGQGGEGNFGFNQGGQGRGGQGGEGNFGFNQGSQSRFGQGGEGSFGFSQNGLDGYGGQGQYGQGEEGNFGYNQGYSQGGSAQNRNGRFPG